MNKTPLNEDVLVCKFYSTSSEINWEKTCSDINEMIASLSSDYLWHKDSMKVIFPLQCDQDSPHHLVSSTCFGDNIEDEWYIVYLVLELTKYFENILVQLTDNDGQFLLIEAADYLPNWIKPDLMDNRVFIYRNSFHIIPPKLIDMKKKINVNTSIQMITEYPEITKADTNIESAIIKRIANQPEHYRKNIHIAIAKLPVDFAAVLKLKPSLVSHIVDAYCNHDIIDAKHCNNLQYDADDCVEINIKFTKFLYVMLMHSKLMKTKISSRLDKNDKRTILGYKLACGLQIIMNQLTKGTSEQKKISLFVKSLQNNGYFKNNIEGSKEYKALLERATDYYKSAIKSSDTEIAETVSSLMNNEEFFKEKQALKKTSNILEEHSEDWLSIQPDQLNDVLNARFGIQEKREDAVTPETLTKELTRFLYQSSDLEGIEINEHESTDEVIEFDGNEFTESIEKMLNLIISEPKDESDSASSDDYESDSIDANMKDELRFSLASDLITKNTQEHKKTTMNNILRSLQEEKGYTGPSSNILKSIGVDKKYLLDSDDDSE